MDIADTCSQLIARLLKEYLADSAPDEFNFRETAAVARALPLVAEMGGVYAINTKGDVLSFGWDNLEVPNEETDMRIRNIALFQGSKRYPEIASLIPDRPHDALTCPHCEGTGIDPFSAKHNIEGIVSYCGGLGWIPKESDRGIFKI
jgi:hypothetical protein